MRIERSTKVTLIGLLVSFYACYRFGGNIEFRDQWVLYDALRNTSAIIFAVIGAWITIIYPEALRQIFNRNVQYSGDGADSIRLLVSNIRYSTFILASILVIGIVAQIVRHLEFFYPYAIFLRAISFGGLGALTFLQVWTLLLTIAQAEIANAVISKVDAEKNERDTFTSEVRMGTKNKSK